MNRKSGIVSLILAVLFSAALMSGCSSLMLASELVNTGNSIVSDNNVIITEDTSRDIVPFSEIKYNRPDIDRICADIDLKTDQVKNIVSYAEAKQLADDVENITDNFSMLFAYAKIKNSIDQSDSYWLDEYNFLSTANTEMCRSYDKFRLALSKTEYKEELADALYYEYFDDIPDFDEKTYDELSTLENELSVLLNSYANKLTLGTVEYNGKEYSCNDIYSDFSSEVFHAWYDRFNHELGEMYISSVKLRNRIAKIYGYDNYMLMYFDRNYRHSQITPDMLEQLIKDIVEYVVPVYEEQGKEGYYYNPDVLIEYGSFSDVISRILNKIDPKMSEVYVTVEKNGYMDINPGQSKESGAYSMFMYQVNMPFLFANYDEHGGFDDIVHEFGHCYEMYVTEDKYPSSLDTEEIFSQGLSMILSNHYVDFMNRLEAYEMQYDFLSGAFSTFIAQPYYTAMELEIYSMDDDDLTVDKINEIAEKYALMFGLEQKGDDLSEYIYQHDWVRITHLFDSPFYTSSYATSEYVAIQLFLLARRDENAAVQAYNSIVNREGGFGFIDNIENAGFKSPFDEGAMQNVAEFGRKFLIEEDWT